MHWTSCLLPKLVSQKTIGIRVIITARVGSEQYLAGNIDGGQKITEI